MPLPASKPGRYLALILVWSGVSAAQPFAEGEAKPADAQGPEQWYGVPVMAADVASLSMLVLAGAAYEEPEDGEPLRQAGVLGYFFGGPIVHTAYGRFRTGLVSLSLRIGLPIGAAILGGGMGFAVDPRDSGTAGDAAVAGAMLGVLAAPVVDASVLAFRPLAEPKAALLVLPRLGRDRVVATLVSEW